MPPCRYQWVLGVSAPSPDKVDLHGTIQLGKHRCVEPLETPSDTHLGSSPHFRGKQRCDPSSSLPHQGICWNHSLRHRWTKRWTMLTELVLQPNLNFLHKVEHPSYYCLDLRRWWVRTGKEMTQAFLHLQKYSIWWIPIQSDEADWLLHHPNLLSHLCLKIITFAARKCNDSKIGKSSCLQEGVNLAFLHIWKWSWGGERRAAMHKAWNWSLNISCCRIMRFLLTKMKK